MIFKANYHKVNYIALYSCEERKTRLTQEAGKRKANVLEMVRALKQSYTLLALFTHEIKGHRQYYPECKYCNCVCYFVLDKKLASKTLFSVMGATGTGKTTVCEFHPPQGLKLIILSSSTSLIIQDLPYQLGTTSILAQRKSVVYSA